MPRDSGREAKKPAVSEREVRPIERFCPRPCQLQEKEYNQHFEMNRSSRRLSHRDHKLSREEQSLEDEQALAAHRAAMDEIAESDAELASRLQAEYEAEVQRMQEAQLKADMELALRLSTEAEAPARTHEQPSTSQEEERDLIDLVRHPVGGRQRSRPLKTQKNPVLLILAPTPVHNHPFPRDHFGSSD
ncbi:CCDC50-N domain-containing protein [Aphelenchoides fujianensis]|nr:CCDC50-N domain-containing protein [Aphelenchoides fujianensis]